jgi:hypothetical protein
LLSNLLIDNDLALVSYSAAVCQHLFHCSSQSTELIIIVLNFIDYCKQSPLISKRYNNTICAFLQKADESMCIVPGTKIPGEH